MVLNIYLTQENTIKLNQLTRKYEVSKSTIAQNVLYYLTKYMIREQKKPILERLGKEYIKENMGKKTSIKPKKDLVSNKEWGFTPFENLTKAYTNVLWIYLNKELANYLTKEDVEKFNNDLNSNLQKTNEPNWDYNHFRRQMWRYERKKNNENT